MTKAESHWRPVTLGELCQGDGLIQTGPFGSQLHASDYDSSGVAVVMPQDISPRGYLDFANVSRVPELIAERLSRHRLRENDIVYSRRGDVEKCALVANADLPAICGTGSLLVRIDSKAEADPRFINYRLGMPDTRTWISQHAVGATMPNLNTGILNEVPLTIPSLPEQQAIAEVLGALDDKIAANNALQGATGQLTAALFAEVTSHLPQAPLSDYAQVNGLSVSPGTGTLRYLDIASVGEGSYESPAEMDWDTAPGRARRRVQRGDTVWSTVRPNRRSHALILEDDANLVCSTGLATLTPKSPGFSFVHEATRTAAFTDYLVQNAKGSAYPAVNAARFSEAPTPNADDATVDSFNALCDPLWERAASAAAESQKLAQLGLSR